MSFFENNGFGFVQVAFNFSTLTFRRWLAMGCRHVCPDRMIENMSVHTQFTTSGQTNLSLALFFSIRLSGHIIAMGANMHCNAFS